MSDSRTEDRAPVTRTYEPSNALGIIEADRQYAVHRLEMVWADAIMTIESRDDIIIRIKKHHEEGEL